jgi:hypothetical protein
VLPAREVVSWFSARRSVDLQGADIDADSLRALADRGAQHADSPALILRIHGNPGHADRAVGSIDIPADTHYLSSLLAAVAVPGRTKTR